MPKDVSFFEKLKDATIGFSGYPRLVRDPKGAFGYMALLLAIVVAINCYLNMVELGRGFAAWSRQVAALPNFGVKNGQFYFDGPMPFRRTAPDGTVLVIDTTGQTRPESLAGQSGILITRDRYYLVQPGMAPMEWTFALLQGDVTKEHVLTLLGSRPERMLSFAYIFVYLAQLLFKAIDGAILALIAILYGAIIRRRIPFALGFKLGLYAMTLPVIIQWVIDDFHTYTAFGFTVWWSLATIYLIFGLRACLLQATPDGPEGPVS